MPTCSNARFTSLRRLAAGVHRGAEHTMDISADLTALSRTAVTVVSSGVKSILDIPKTLEVLETLGVPVCAYKTKEFPGFFTNVTGCPSPMVVNSPVEAALMMYHSKQLGLPNGMLVAVPNPAPTTSKGSLDDRSMARMIEEAVREAAAKEISGAAITPYLLSKVAELTGGHSVDSNVALVCNNAVVATMIASEYSKLMLNDTGRNDSIIKHTSYPTLRKNAKLTASDHVIVIGGMVIDHVVRPLPKNDNGSVQELIMGTSNPGIASQTFGGVGRNIAEAVAVASREGSGTVSVSMVSAIGDDAHGALLLRHSSDIGLDVAHVLSIPGSRTATYTAVHDHHGDLTVAIADMAVLKDIPVTAARQFLSSSSSFKRSIVVADANLSISAFKAVGDFLQADPHIMFFEPTSVPKCTLPIVANCFNQVYCGTNKIENMILLYPILNLD